jgi:CheY-like chemotaxis protein
MLPALEEQPSQFRILVIEDEVLIRILVAESLRDAGFIVIETASADEAWSFIMGGGEMDLVFSDINMPGSMDGLELARRLQSHDPDLPIILSSGRGWNGPEKIIRFLPKPYTPSQVVSLIHELLPDGILKGNT